MALVAVELTQFTARIPRRLHRTLKVHCVATDVSLMRFVMAAIVEKLRRETRTQRRHLQLVAR